MPKQFVPGTSMCALCKTVFGDKITKNLHGDQWKSSVVQGVILPQPLGGKKVLVEWSDPPHNLLLLSRFLALHVGGADGGDGEGSAGVQGQSRGSLRPSLLPPKRKQRATGVRPPPPPPYRASPM